MRRPIPARVPLRCPKLAFEPLESRDLLAADVGLEWVDASDLAFIDDWSWTFDESSAGDTAADQGWDDGFWVDDGAWTDGSSPPQDATGFAGAAADSTEEVSTEVGWVAEGPADAPDVDSPAAPVTTTDAVQPPPVALETPDTGEASKTPELPADPVEDSRDSGDFSETAVTVGVVDEADVTTDDVTTDDDADLVCHTAVDDDTTADWVIDETPSEDPTSDDHWAVADLPETDLPSLDLPGTVTVDALADLPVAVASIVVAPVRSAPLVDAPVSLVESAATAVPASRFAGWGAFFMPLFGPTGGGAEAAAIGGQTDGQPGSGRPRIRLPFRPVV